MKKVLKALGGIAVVGAVIGGIVYFVKKRELDDDFDDFDDLDDFDDFDDLDEEEEEEDNLERVYTSINLDAETPAGDAGEAKTEAGKETKKSAKADAKAEA